MQRVCKVLQRPSLCLLQCISSINILHERTYCKLFIFIPTQSWYCYIHIQPVRRALLDICIFPTSSSRYPLEVEEVSYTCPEWMQVGISLCQHSVNTLFIFLLSHLILSHFIMEGISTHFIPSRQHIQPLKSVFEVTLLSLKDFAVIWMSLLLWSIAYSLRLDRLLTMISRRTERSIARRWKTFFMSWKHCPNLIRFWITEVLWFCMNDWTIFVVISNCMIIQMFPIGWKRPKVPVCYQQWMKRSLESWINELQKRSGWIHRPNGRGYAHFSGKKRRRQYRRWNRLNNE